MRMEDGSVSRFAGHQAMHARPWRPSTTASAPAVGRRESPRHRTQRAEWLTHLLENGTIDVVARNGSRAVGHAILVSPAAGGAHELAVFVGPDSRGVGIGNELLSALLGAANVAGLEHVELTVEHRNRPARCLYQRHGFEITGRDSFILEMSRAL
ncbi:GCN5-related N-acetyltransferase [halophilic archaeon DL31]|nr:GCN5-related N-acetyltransferase [halophilic archaeon DL31]